MSARPIHLALNPDVYRVRAKSLGSRPEATAPEKALADCLVLMCDRYDELRAVFGINVGQVVSWPFTTESAHTRTTPECVCSEINTRHCPVHAVLRPPTPEGGAEQ